MITNQRQYNITKAQVRRFEEALGNEDASDSNVHPRFQQAIHESVQSQLDELRAQLVEYDALRAGRLTVLSLDSLDDLPDAMIQARAAARLTQKELAERLGLKEQQIQRWESTRYAGVSLARIQEIVETLGMKIQETVILPNPVHRGSQGSRRASRGRGSRSGSEG